jgi:hypothetical protein
MPAPAKPPQAQPSAPRDTGERVTDCPTCGAPAHPEGPDAVIDSSDGPLLLTRWRCARRHWWHTTTDTSPVRTAGTGGPQAQSLASDVAALLSRLGQPGRPPPPSTWPLRQAAAGR